VDYIDDDAKPAAPKPRPDGAADLELDSELDSERGPGSDARRGADGAVPSDDVDPLLAELLPEDRQSRRRVVTALLRAVLAERKVT